MQHHVVRSEHEPLRRQLGHGGAVECVGLTEAAPLRVQAALLTGGRDAVAVSDLLVQKLQDLHPQLQYGSFVLFRKQISRIQEGDDEYEK